MKAEFDQNNLEQGYARVTLLFEDSDQPFAPGDSIAIGKAVGNDNWEYISRAGGNKWVGAPQPLMLNSKPKVDSDQAVFLLQPAYVDMMEDGPYTVHLMGTEGTSKTQASMSAYDISWSGLDNTETLKDYSEEEANLAGEKAKEEAHKRAEAEKKKAQEEVAENAEKQMETVVLLAQEEAELCVQEENAQLAVEKAQADHQAEAEKKIEIVANNETQEAQHEVEAETQEKLLPVKKSGKGGLIAIAVVILLMLGGGAYYYWSSQNAEREAMLTEKKATEEAARKAKEEAAKAEAARKVEEARQKAARADAKGRVAAFFAGKRTPQAAMQLASELDCDTPEQQDAVFRLYYYAAEQDSPEGTLRYAQCIDPTKPAWGTVKKDGAEAWYYYGKSPDGEKSRQELKKWVQEAASSGNPQARAWLKEME